MAVTNDPIFAQTPLIGIATLTTPTAITSRANITGTTGLVALVATSTNGFRLDKITVKGKGTSLAGELFVWLYDGTTSYIYDEIDLTAVTGSTTLASLLVTKTYTNVNLKATTQSLYVSVSVQQDLNIFAHGGNY